MALFCCILLVAAAIYVCGDFVHVDMAVMAEATKGERFVASTVMILLTMALLPLSLRLFRFKRVTADLKEHGAVALKKWGVIRLACLGLLLVANTFLYYAFAFESAYGYLAVVTLLCMPFVVPTMNRCKEEVS